MRNSPIDDDDDDSDFPYGNDAEDLYDSPFEVLNQNELISQIVQILNNGYQELQQSISSLLSEQEAKTLKSIIQDDGKSKST